MSYQTLNLRVDDHLATISLNRPDAYNAINLQLARELLEVTNQVDEDRDVRCVVLTGVGKAFCAGGDVREFHDQLARIGGHLKQLTASLHNAIARIAGMPKPVIAAVNGVVAGAGLGLMLACDLSYAVENATVMVAYTRIGATPDASLTFWLPRLVGMRRALELTYLNRVLTAREACAWGLFNGVISADKFPDEIFGVARQIAVGPTLAYARSKKLCNLTWSQTLESQMEFEAREISGNSKTDDFREGVLAFIKKRPPTFHGI
jgi:2-(1,2-epoxy-1,2-dihydrophenyl)acetyl-CoA isomerase